MYGDHLSVLAISLGIFVSLVSWGLIAFRISFRGRFDLADVFLLGVGTVYGAGCSFIIWATESGRNPGGARIIGEEPSFWVVPMLALVCILACLTIATLAAPRHRDPAWAKWYSRQFDEKQWQAGLMWLGWAFLAIALTSSTLYTRAYGGFREYFEVADAIRSGLFEETGENPLSFLKPFGGLSFFASYLFAAVVVSSRQYRLWSGAGFLVSLAWSSATLLGWGGRVDLLTYWITLLLGGLIYRMGVLPRLLSGAAVLFVTMLVILPPLTDLMNPGKSQPGYVAFFALELTFPLESSLHSLDLQEHRNGIDIATAPLFLMPQRIWDQMGIRTISDISTEALLGQPGSGGTIPVDLVTFGLYQFGLAGPLIIAAFWCLLLIWIDKWIVERLPRSISSFLYAHAVISVAALSILYFDFHMQIARNFHFILGTIVILGVPWIASTSRRRIAATRYVARPSETPAPSSRGSRGPG